MDKHDRNELESIRLKAEKMEYSYELIDDLEMLHKEAITIITSIGKEEYAEEITELNYSINKFIPDCRACNKSEQGQAKAEFGWAKRELISNIHSVLNIRFKQE